VIIAVALFAGALISIIALLVYALWQLGDIIQQLDDIKKEQAYASRIIQQYDKRESQKQHIRVHADERDAYKAPPVEVRKARGVPDPDLTTWSSGI
jgi:hypothetical protein